MQLDTRLTWPVVILFVLSCFIPLLADFHVPIFQEHFVRQVENVQAIFLLFFAVFSYFYMRPLTLSRGKKIFWLWAILWWVLLFGRSTSWGRDYFPDVPKPYFRAISVLLIGSVTFMLFSKTLWQEILAKFQYASIPIWGFLLAVFGLIVSDAVEHHRIIASVFLHDSRYQDLVEELYEFLVIFGLFLVALPIMNRDKHTQSTSEVENQAV
ncbi:hypothetical protein EXE30_02610 [Acinetobacter halotolerans]|uniref:Nitric oxide reductase n=1 Tax=Acinetobacter halotolerans TaxID=1752076 RepID=A0A4V2DB80_9GAMM|nr:hypothetical protein [Acinetobacter halotolerans]RZF55719.1 hypothetical protein EXE30_02610 [Acinetobacter halotolerans]